MPGGPCDEMQIARDDLLGTLTAPSIFASRLGPDYGASLLTLRPAFDTTRALLIYQL